MPDYRRRAAREAMSARLDVNGMMAGTIGQAGIVCEEVQMLARRSVEESRRFTYGLAECKGVEAQRAEMEAWWARRHAAYVL